MVEAFRTGEGIGWHEHDPNLFEGTERFFRPGYNAHLVSEWIPALNGVEAKLEAGAKRRRRRLRPRRLDRHHGEGVPALQVRRASTITCRRSRARASAPATPASPIACASRSPRRRTSRASRATIWSRSSTACTTWAIRSAPRRTCARRSSPTAPGCWSSRSPNDRVEDNLNPLGRVFYSVSTLVCTPASLAQEVGLGARRTGG